MNHEVRLVPANWEHPRRENGHFRGLFSIPAFEVECTEWDFDCALWQKGLVQIKKDGPTTVVPKEHEGKPYAAIAGPRPTPEDCMPAFEAGTATFFMLYGRDTLTPRSPGFATLEELTQYLADARVPVNFKEPTDSITWLTLLRNDLDRQFPKEKPTDGNADVLPVPSPVAGSEEPGLPDDVHAVPGEGGSESEAAAVPPVRSDDGKAGNALPELPSERG
jgi:hypothetical protein